VLKQYKKNVIGTQLAIAVITAAMLFQSHRWATALASFLVMQLGAIAGAAWGAALTGRMERNRGAIRTR
jgi:hypothetical protein